MVGHVLPSAFDGILQDAESCWFKLIRAYYIGLFEKLTIPIEKYEKYIYIYVDKNAGAGSQGP